MTPLQRLKIILLSFCSSFLFFSITSFAALPTETPDSPPIEPEPPFKEFTDVSEGNPHYVSVNALKKSGLLDGYEDGSYKPYNKINRAEAVKLLMEASDRITSTQILSVPEEQPFIDTPILEWYTPYLAFAKEAEIISGYDDGTYKPDQEVLLAEALRIYFESLPNVIYPIIEDNLYPDTPLESWFTKYTAYAHSREALNILSDGNIDPAQPVTRGYMADIIYKIRNYPNGSRFGKATWYGDAVAGNFTASGEIFDPDLMTAAHKELPFGTMVDVTNMANGKTIRVKINDRGPYGPGRVIDLSSAAFEQIASLGAGIINVEFKILEPEQTE